MKSRTKALIFIISFFVMMATLPIMQALDDYILCVIDLIITFISAFSFLFFLIYWMFPNKRERALARAKARKDLENSGNHLPWEPEQVFHAL